MKTKTAFLITILLFLAGCKTAESTSEPTTTDLPLAGKLTFAGSTTVQPLIGELGDIYHQQNPEVILDIAAGGSVVGIEAVHDGTVDIGMASRALKPEEAEGINQFQIAVDVIAIIVHPDNPVADLSFKELRGIYSGEITNWEQVDGPTLDVVPVIRETTSGTRGAFDEIVLDKEMPNAPNMVTAITAGDVAATVSKDPGAVGYVGFGNLDDSVSLVSIDGVIPSKQSANDGSYPILRPLLLLTSPFTQPLADDFIQFVLSDEIQVSVEELGWIPVN